LLKAETNGSLPPAASPLRSPVLGNAALEKALQQRLIMQKGGGVRRVADVSTRATTQEFACLSAYNTML